VFVLFMGAILVVLDTRAVLDLPPILAGLAMAAAIGLGVGMINALLFPLFPLWKSLWGIVTTPLLFVSTVIYLFEDLPPLGREVLWWNPLVHIIGMMRRGIYGIYDAPWVSPFYVFALSGILTLLGLILLGRYQRGIVNQEFD
jgi:capsular polysaccharide transport system permease protein